MTEATSGLGGFEAFPEESLAIAAAMVRRDAAEQRDTNVLLASMGIEQAPLSTETQQMMQTGATLVKLEALENPGQPIDYQRFMNDMCNDDIVRATLRPTLDREPTPEEVAELQQTVAATVTAIHEAIGLNDSKAVDDLRKQSDATKRVAERHAVSPADVYDSDELYDEMMRELYDSPAAQASACLEMTGKFDLTFFKNFLTTAQRQEIATDPNLSADEKAAELALFEQDFDQMLLEDDELREAIQIMANKAQQAMTIKSVAMLERVWGMEGMLELPEHMQRRLVVQKDFSKAEFESGNELLAKSTLRMQRCMDVLKTMCMEQGWDATQLSQDQLTAIYGSEAWQTAYED